MNLGKLITCCSDLRKNESIERVVAGLQMCEKNLPLEIPGSQKARHLKSDIHKHF